MQGRIGNKQTTFNFGWVSSVFVRLRVENRFFFDLYSEDSETGEIVVVIVKNSIKQQITP